MMTKKQFRLSTVAAALAAVFGAAMADEAEIDALIQPDSSVSVGVGNWSGDDRRQTGVYDAMQKNGNYGFVDADVNKRDNDSGTWFKLKARNVGLENGEIKGEYLKQGDIGVGLEYNQITRDDPNAFKTNLKGIGTTRLIQNNAYGSTAADYTNKTGRFAPQTTLLDNLGTKREQTGLSFFKNLEGLFPGLEFNVNFKNEDKTGTRNWSRGGDQSAFFAVEPIDSTTRQLEAALSYTTPKFQVRGGYNGSWYQNNTSKLMVIGQTGLEHTVAKSNTTFLSLPLDNEAHQLFLNGGYNFTKDTRGTFKLEYARATQNDHNPSTDITTANGYTANLSNMNPPGSLNAKVDTTLAQFGLTSRVTKDFSVNASLRYHNKDDKTPIVNYIGGEVNGATTYPVYPYVRSSYKTLSGKVEGTYRLSDGYSVVAGLEERQQDRREPVLANGTEKEGVVPFRHKLDETTTRLEVRRAMTETVNGSVSWVNARRDGSSYSLMEPDTFSFGGKTYDMGNKINPISVADRNRDKIRLSMDWSPIDAVSLQFVAENGQDKYSGENAFGLKKGTTQLYSVDAAWSLSEKLSLNAWYSYDQTKAEQTGFLTAVAGTRRYELTDSAESVGLGVKWEATPRLRTGANLQWTKSVGRYDTAAWNNAGVQYATTTGAPGTITPSVVGTTNLPKITNRYLRVSLFSLYALDKSSDVRFDLVQDYWKTNDWTWQFADGSPLIMNDGTTAVLSPKQSATFVSARYIYKF